MKLLNAVYFLLFASLLFHSELISQYASTNNNAPFIRHKVRTVPVAARDIDKKKIEIQRSITRQKNAFIRVLDTQKEIPASAQRVQSVKTRSPKKLFFRGSDTHLYECPKTFASVRTAGVRQLAGSNVLVNGKSRDTISYSDPITLSFTLPPNEISARVNVYIDVNKNGIHDPADYQLLYGAAIDNSDEDQDPADGSVKIVMSNLSVYSSVIGGLIFEVIGHSSTSSAYLVVKQKQRASVVIISSKPAIPYLIFVGGGFESGMLVSTLDSAGKAVVTLDRTVFSTVLVRGIDFSGVANGYIPAETQPKAVFSDTTYLTLDFGVANSFIEGYVRDNTGTPVARAQIQGMGEYNSMTYSDSSGYYKLGVTGGNWTLFVSTPFSESYIEINNTVDVYVSPEATTRKDLLVRKANSTISGKVTMGTAGLAGIELYALLESEDLYVNNSVYTDVDGNYSIPIFKPDTGRALYWVDISLPFGYSTPTQNFKDVAPGTIGLNFPVTHFSGGIRGVITDRKTGTPVAHAEVECVKMSDSTNSVEYYYASTNDSGYYRIHLPDGQYSFAVNALKFSRSGEYRASITGTLLTHDFSLIRTGSISGTVVDPLGRPLSSVFIRMLDSTGNSVNAEDVPTNEKGEFNVYGLTTGKYMAYVQHRTIERTYGIQWYDGKVTQDSATWISVTDGFDTPNVNFNLVYGGTISGRVTNARGTGIPRVYIGVFDTAYSSRSWTITNDSGYYLATGLPTGICIVSAQSELYAGEWYGHSYSYETAARIPVTVDRNTPNINFMLELGAQISGTVKSKSGALLINAEIIVLDTAGYIVAAPYADVFGYYSAVNLPHDEPLYVAADDWGYAARWSGNSKTREGASALILRPEEVRTAINFVLPFAGRITGIVKNNAGKPIRYVPIIAQPKNDPYKFWRGESDAAGNFIIDDLDDGSYTLFTDSNEYYAQWYNLKNSAEMADSVIVQEEKTSASINFMLTAPGAVSGTVNNAAGKPISGATISLYDSSFTEFGTEWTNQNGVFYFAGIQQGAYYLKASAPGFISQWYDHKKSAAEATKLIVFNDSVRSTIQFSLSTRTSSIVHVPAEYPTIGEAMGMTLPGDTILVGPGVYYETVFMNEGIHLIGAGYQKSIIDAKGKPMASTGSVIISAPSCEVRGFTVRNARLDTIENVGAGIECAHSNIIRENRITNCRVGISVSDSCIIENNVVVNNPGVAGISAGSGKRSIIKNNTIVKNACGVQFTSASPAMVNNIIYNNTKYGIANLGTGSFSIVFNDVYKNGLEYFGLTSQTGLKGNFSADPLFMNPDSGDYRLKANSPCIDKGDPASSPDPDSTIADLGAFYYHHTLTDVRYLTLSGQIPSAYGLLQNFPNPFNPQTTIAYALPSASHVRLVIFNILGQVVRELVNEKQSAGWKEIQWNAGNVSSGIYFFKIDARSILGETTGEGQSSSYTEIKRMLLIK